MELAYALDSSSVREKLANSRFLRPSVCDLHNPKMAKFCWGRITCVRIVHPILVTLLAREASTALFRRHAFARSENPNGIPSQSPGLRGTSCPGSSSVKPPQPQRGCGQSVPDRGHDLGRNAVGVEIPLTSAATMLIHTLPPRHRLRSRSGRGRPRPRVLSMARRMTGTSRPDEPSPPQLADLLERSLQHATPPDYIN